MSGERARARPTDLIKKGAKKIPPSLLGRRGLPVIETASSRGMDAKNVRRNGAMRASAFDTRSLISDCGARVSFRGLSANKVPWKIRVKV